MVKTPFKFIRTRTYVDADLELVLARTTPADPVKKYVPGYEFDMRETGKTAKVGSIRLRIGRTRALSGWCGHIGYGVDEPARGRRYAARSCRLLFPLAYAHGLRTLWITCDPKNLASRRTCEIAGGQYVDTVRVPRGTEMHAEGRRRVRRYRFDLAAILRTMETTVKHGKMNRYDEKWVRTYYDQYGEKEWHRWEKSPADEVKLHVHHHYLRKHIRSGSRVLEIGAGAGRFTQLLAARGARIVVADISPGQLRLNRLNARRRGYGDRVETWLRLDMCRMNRLADETFDAVVCYGGPLSYAFERREAALCELLRVLKPSGTLLVSVMSLWGAVHQFLPTVMDLPPEENRLIIQTGDLHPDHYKACTHRCHMFRAAELREFLEVGGAVDMLSLSSSNCLSAAWGAEMQTIRGQPRKWKELLRLELEACREPGGLDMGTHIIAAARKRARQS